MIANYNNSKMLMLVITLNILLSFTSFVSSNNAHDVFKPTLALFRRSSSSSLASVMATKSSIHSNNDPIMRNIMNRNSNRLFDIRGGGDIEISEYDDEYDETDSDDFNNQSIEERNSNDNQQVSIFSIISRSFKAGIDAMKDENNEELSLIGKVITVMSSMINAVFQPAQNNNDDSDTDDMEGRSEKEEELFRDFGGFLSNAYHVTLPDDDDENARASIDSGPFTDALQNARSAARLLVVFIPASKPSKKKQQQKSHDQIAIRSILSSDVHKVSEKKSRKKESYGSFLFWSTKPNSSDASTTIKRLKIKPSSSKSKKPVLLVAYPSQTIDSRGRPKIVPRILAQHHCNPPPTPESMSAWLNALRKRHAKQYDAMQHELREIKLFKERSEGYTTSAKEDTQREEDKLKEEQKRLEEERIQKEKEGALKERRKILLESLPEEPQSIGEGIITIALRIEDGRKGQRRFIHDTKIDVVFNWVDAMFEIERESIILTTMNGRQSFSYGEDEDMSLEDSGLGRLAALRVTKKKIESNDSESNDSENEE